MKSRRQVALILVAATAAACVDKGNRALSQAISNHDFAAAEEMIRAGKDVNYSEGGETTLMILATTNDTAAVRFLLDHKANVDLADRHGRTALMYAAWKGQVENIRLLVAAGAKLEAFADQGQTAVSVAKAAKQDEAVAVLLSLGANDVPAKAMY